LRTEFETIKPLPVSLCIIAWNESDNLPRCFENIGSAVDEILLLDTGSTDSTIPVAESLGAEVFPYDWDENFSNARNTLMKRAKNDWVLWIDGDEYFPPELVAEIGQAVQSYSDNVGYFIPRKNYYFGKWLRYGKNYPDYQLKLFRKSKASGYKKRIHEKIILNGKTGYLKYACEHHPYPTIDSYFKKFHKYTSLEAKNLSDSGEQISLINSIKWLIIKPIIRFTRRFILYGGFRNGLPGLFASFFDCAGYVVRYIKLWEMKKQQ